MPLFCTPSTLCVSSAAKAATVHAKWSNFLRDSSQEYPEPPPPKNTVTLLTHHSAAPRLLSSGASHSGVSFDRGEPALCPQRRASCTQLPTPRVARQTFAILYRSGVNATHALPASILPSPTRPGWGAKQPSHAAAVQGRSSHSPGQPRTPSCRCSVRPPTGWGSCHWGISQRGNSGWEAELPLSERPPEARGHCSSPARSTSTE